MRRLIGLFLVSLILLLNLFNVRGYLYASETKQITVIESIGEDGDVTLVDENGDVYTKENKKEVIKKTYKDGNSILIDEDGDVFVKSSQSNVRTVLFMFVLDICLILVILIVIAAIVFTL